MQIRRIVTGVDEAGSAIVVSDGPTPRVIDETASVGVLWTSIWITDETPALLDGNVDPAFRKVGIPPPPGGSIFRIVEFVPKSTVKHDDAAFLEHFGTGPGGATGQGTQHRTRSIDYAIVMAGEIDLALDESEVHLKTGDVIVQRGTNHDWINRSDAPCRIAFVLIDAVDFPKPSANYSLVPPPEGDHP